MHLALEEQEAGATPVEASVEWVEETVEHEPERGAGLSVAPIPVAHVQNQAAAQWAAQAHNCDERIEQPVVVPGQSIARANWEHIVPLSVEILLVVAVGVEHDVVNAEGSLLNRWVISFIHVRNETNHNFAFVRREIPSL